MQRHVVPDVVRDQDLLTLPPGASVQDAAHRMRERRVRSVLVVEAERLVGIFTGTDLIDRVVAEGRPAGITSLSEVMTAEPQTVTSGTLAIEALQTMHEGGFRHLPVVDDGQLVAILSRRDFLKDEEDEIAREEQLWQRL